MTTPMTFISTTSSAYNDDIGDDEKRVFLLFQSRLAPTTTTTRNMSVLDDMTTPMTVLDDYEEQSHTESSISQREANSSFLQHRSYNKNVETLDIAFWGTYAFGLAFLD